MLVATLKHKSQCKVPKHYKKTANIHKIKMNVRNVTEKSLKLFNVILYEFVNQITTPKHDQANFVKWRTKTYEEKTKTFPFKQS